MHRNAQQYEGAIIDVPVQASKEDRMNEKFSDIEKYKITKGAISGPLEFNGAGESKS